MYFNVSARYERYLIAAVALAIAEAQKDERFREDDDERVRALASVPDHLIDSSLDGKAYVLVGAVNTAPEPDLGDHLHAFTPSR